MMTDGEAVDEPRILALCAGYGGLEEAVTRIIGGTVVAFAETHPAAAAVFAAHHPGVPNLGDITAADWYGVLEEHRPDVVAAGFPCQDISVAGHGEGISGERSGIWKNVAEAAASMSLPVTWPHTGTTSAERAYERTRWAGPTSATGGSGSRALLKTPTADGHGGACTSDKRQGGLNLRTAVTLLPTPAASPYGRNRSVSPGAAIRPSLEYLVRDLLPTPKGSLGGDHRPPGAVPDRAGNAGQPPAEPRVQRMDDGHRAGPRHGYRGQPGRRTARDRQRGGSPAGGSGIPLPHGRQQLE